MSTPANINESDSVGCRAFETITCRGISRFERGSGCWRQARSLVSSAADAVLNTQYEMKTAPTDRKCKLWICNEPRRSN